MKTNINGLASSILEEENINKNMNDAGDTVELDLYIERSDKNPTNCIPSFFDIAKDICSGQTIPSDRR